MGSEVLKLCFVGVVGYLLGSANSSLIVGKFYGVDVRKHGSGNAGATNTLRTLGKKAALFTTIGDMLKGFIACLIGMYLAGDTGVIIGGMAAVAGHNWPVFFGFKGGKGILTTLAVVLMMEWKIALILLGIFIIIVAISRYISLGSITSAALLPVFALIFNKSVEFVVVSFILALIAIARHRKNISRILNGTESKFGVKKSS
ncbi:acyl-phosphate glycerol 3-phosphate acyltransferase [Clostridium thermosuccinogenes]|uniref:Glycerol-3-phosphate acyltransferase n=1 Tax=Clostridium thermosuccinogenes TaxID=84032 RepID=A0A2K2FKP4_9CLOT|nr:glycerol-3-phosphate 1-O-acyltransferase PlsY [Pseudoclostridium thermosuccinogenes]AUS95969.1 acyl-phosphate glycerol 3-phosphate acyltransferase [Pseudoclostridium thermosuccinogenes]PNT93309.1 acyl-phosphate glycerol 3-phosphate acyltransferase [Pseudoclostridium thermosuccinogenes]PNT99358.1 acyl-phosphate glycerol 3-phosphate acyltransferase [Pseudoclostridium thermosuccinogenes]PNU01045.1 acyl-phosphate glycerol 3-phosphate acyltransferase [Pseudoclostridium thermosuccinogenes]